MSNHATAAAAAAVDDDDDFGDFDSVAVGPASGAAIAGAAVGAGAGGASQPEAIASIVAVDKPKAADPFAAFDF